MTKTQIQVPEELFQEIRTFAKQREWSLAETFRRGAELLLQMYPEKAAQSSVAWVPPTSNRVGWKGLSAGQLRDAAFADGEPHLA
ncbi:MAG: antitoxin [Chthoniobacteraceae bacterium]